MTDITQAHIKNSFFLSLWIFFFSIKFPMVILYRFNEKKTPQNKFQDENDFFYHNKMFKTKDSCTQYVGQISKTVKL